MKRRPGLPWKVEPPATAVLRGAPARALVIGKNESAALHSCSEIRVTQRSGGAGRGVFRSRRTRGLSVIREAS
jgi:hypothetical protein